MTNVEETPTLQMLFDAIGVARGEQRMERRRTGTSAGAMATAQLATLRALEEYTAALEARRYPVPPQIQTDLRLHRAICAKADRANRFRN